MGKDMPVEYTEIRHTYSIIVRTTTHKNASKETCQHFLARMNLIVVEQEWCSTTNR